jgi:MFS transporter, DHA2 family, multidrug resistance protein
VTSTFAILEARPRALGGWVAVGAAGLAIFALSQDGSMIITSLPAIGAALGLSPTASVWLLLAASVPTIGLMLPLGSWADASGNRPAFLLGAAGYALSAVAVALAPGFAWLVAARALEGASAALLLVAVMTVASAAVGAANRAQAIGAVTAAGTLGSISGPQLVAILLPTLGWRSVFLVSVPLVLAALAVGWVSIDGELSFSRPRATWAVEAAALTAAVAGFFLLLRTAPVGLESSLSAAGLGAMVVVGLGAWSRLPQAEAIFRLVSTRRMSVPLSGLGVMPLAVGVMAFAVPYYLLGGGGGSLQVAALAFMVFAFGQGVSSSLGGSAMRRWGSWPVAVAGAAGLAVSMLLLIPLDPAWGPGGLIWRVALIGLGSGIVAGCNQSSVMSLAPRESAAAASAVSGLLRGLSFSLGAAIASAAALLAPTPLLGLRIVIAVAAGVAVASLGATLRARNLLDEVDQLDRHPVTESLPLT